VRIGDLPDSSMQATKVGQVRRMICASPAYLEENGIPDHPDELGQHRLILSSGVASALQWRLMQNGEPYLVKIQPRMTTTSNDSAVAAAVAGFGLTRLLSYQVADQLHDGSLQTVLTEFEPSPLPVHVVHREGRQASQKVRAFLDLAIERLRADAALH
jgi:DNA-binding transcriptional LysR family regulator